MSVQSPARGSEPESAQVHERKRQVLTQGTPSGTTTIADAVVLKDGDLFFLTQPDGRVPAGGKHGLGLYYHDCRFLNGYDLRLAGAPAVALGATAAAGQAATFQLTNMDLRVGDDGCIAKEQLGITWVRTLDEHALTLEDRITVRNWGHQAVGLPLELQFEAGFEDVFQVRGLLREHLGHRGPPSWERGRLVFRYQGADNVTRTLTVSLDPELEPAGDAGARTWLALKGREAHEVKVRLQVGEDPAPTGDDPAARAGANEGATRYAEVRSDNVLFDRALGRSFRDLDLLRSDIGGHQFFAAGVPWFATLFGRDSLITALQVLAFEPETAASTLELLAGYQGTQVDNWRDEEPGKILHELRVGEMARAGEIPHTPYYGSVDATPLFLILLARHAAWTGDLTLFGSLRPNVERALEWIDRWGDHDGDGYVDYDSTTDRGLINQGWKDSGDAIVNRDGSLATPPIALPEVQAYVYLAKRGLAMLYRQAGDPGRADRLLAEAGALRERFNRDFWVEELGTYALALEAGGRPLAVVASNAGQALWGGIAEADKAHRVANRLMAEDVFSGWGVRTLATSERGYTPIGYHLGTVWPHDNSIIAAGCRRYGLDAPAHRIAEGIIAAAGHFEHERLPELFTGFSREQYGAPVRYPVACHPQAWAAGSVPFLLEQLLGLVPDGFEGRLRVVRPSLPGFVDRLEIKGLRVGQAAAHLRFRKVAGRTVVEVASIRGNLRVEVES